MTNTKKQISHAKSIHGDNYRYKRIKGTSIELSTLKPKIQFVCYGGNSWHILGTLKPHCQSKRIR
jgi:hypothetical protein